MQRTQEKKITSGKSIIFENGFGYQSRKTILNEQFNMTNGKPTEKQSYRMI